MTKYLIQAFMLAEDLIQIAEYDPDLPGRMDLDVIDADQVAGATFSYYEAAAQSMPNSSETEGYYVTDDAQGNPVWNAMLQVDVDHDESSTVAVGYVVPTGTLPAGSRIVVKVPGALEGSELPSIDDCRLDAPGVYEFRLLPPWP